MASHTNSFYMFLGFRKIVKNRLLTSSCLSVCPSAWNNSAANAWIFMKFHVPSIFLKSVEKAQVWSKSERITGTLQEDICTLMTISCWSVLRRKNASDKSCTENQNSHFMFNSFIPKTMQCIIQLGMQCLLLFHGNTLSRNAPQCYAIRAMRLVSFRRVSEAVAKIEN